MEIWKRYIHAKSMTEFTQYDKTVCDICGTEIMLLDDEYYVRVGYFSDPQKPYHIRYEPDICIDCFRFNIVPFLQSLGVTTKEITSIDKD